MKKWMAFLCAAMLFVGLAVAPAFAEGKPLKILIVTSSGVDDGNFNQDIHSGILAFLAAVAYAIYYFFFAEDEEELDDDFFDEAEDAAEDVKDAAEDAAEEIKETAQEIKNEVEFSVP